MSFLSVNFLLLLYNINKKGARKYYLFENYLTKRNLYDIVEKRMEGKGSFFFDLNKCMSCQHTFTHVIFS